MAALIYTTIDKFALDIVSSPCIDSKLYTNGSK